jgi:hypothetical protein
MRRKAAIAAVALLALAAAPSALARGAVAIPGPLVGALKGLAPAAVPAALTRKDKLRSCQAGAPRSRVRGTNETERRGATVACEEPTRPNLNVGSGLKAAEAGAIAAGG